MMLRVVIKRLDSRDFEFYVDSEKTVAELKEHIAETVGVIPLQQRLIFQGRVLQDDRRLRDYDINDKVIHLVDRAPPSTTTYSQGGTSALPSADHNRNSGGQRNNDNRNVLVAAFAMPVMEYDADEIRRSVRRILDSMGETGTSSDVTTESRPNSLDVHIILRNARNSSEGPAFDRLRTARSMLRGATALLNIIERNDRDNQSHAEKTQTPVEELSAAPALTGERETFARTSTGDASSAPTSPTGFDKEYDVERAELEESFRRQSQEQRSVSGDSRSIPTASSLASVMEEIIAIEDRLRSHMPSYLHLLRGDQNYADNQAEGRAGSRFFDRVQRIMHNLSHAYHAVSDLDIHFCESAPRNLYPQQTAAVLQGVNETEITLSLQTAAVPSSVPVSSNSTTANDPSSTRQASNIPPFHAESGAIRIPLGRFQIGPDRTFSNLSSSASAAALAADGNRVAIPATSTSGGSGFMWAEVGPNSLSLNGVSFNAVSSRDADSSNRTRHHSAPESPPAARDADGRATPGSDGGSRSATHQQQNEPPAGLMQQLMQSVASAMTSMTNAVATGSSATASAGDPRSEISGAAAASQNPPVSFSFQGSSSASMPPTTFSTSAQNPPVSAATAAGGPLEFFQQLFQNVVQGASARPTASAQPMQQPYSRPPRPPGESEPPRVSAQRRPFARDGDNTAHGNTVPVGIQFQAIPYQPGVPPSVVAGQFPPLFIGPTPPTELPLFTLDPLLPCPSRHFAAEARLRIGALPESSGFSMSTSSDQVSSATASAGGGDSNSADDNADFLTHFEAIVRSVLDGMLDGRSSGQRSKQLFAADVVGVAHWSPRGGSWASIRFPPSEPTQTVFLKQTKENRPAQPVRFGTRGRFIGRRGRFRHAAPHAEAGIRINNANREQSNASQEQDVASIIGGVMQNVLQGSNQTIASFCRGFGVPVDASEGFFGDLFENVAEHLTFAGLMGILGDAPEGPLNDLRPHLRRFIASTFLSDNEHPSVEGIRSASRQIVRESEDGIRLLMSGVPTHEHINAVQSLLTCEQHHMEAILQLLFSEPEESPAFGRRFYDRCFQALQVMAALCVYCCRDGRSGCETPLENSLRQLEVPTALSGHMETIRRQYVNRLFDQAAHIPEADLLGFIVSRSVVVDERHVGLESEEASDFVDASAHVAETSANVAKPATASNVTGVVKTSTDNNLCGFETESSEDGEYMDVPEHVETHTSTTRTTENGVVEDENWREAFPPELVRVIECDIARQEQQLLAGESRPFSDAYLSGMPSKKRKKILDEKPPLVGTSENVFRHSLCNAVQHANVRPITGALVDDVISAAEVDSVLLDAFECELSDKVITRLNDDKDYTENKYPNAAKYFMKKT